MNSRSSPADRALGLHSLPDDLLLAILRLLPETFERDLQLSPGAEEGAAAEPGDSQPGESEQEDEESDEEAEANSGWVEVTSRQAGKVGPAPATSLSLLGRGGAGSFGPALSAHGTAFVA